MRSHGAEMDDLDGSRARLQGTWREVTHVVFPFILLYLKKTKYIYCEKNILPSYEKCSWHI